ncbi:ORF6N domain-containing protein [Lactobacillus bombicola]|uniref:KilA-N DNA-binding domain-containing protein n=1 Tax=Lactobacillus bombicola TaxID=1505723 RepID=A0ABX9LWU4_9LACO|nr:ORF6N domain-containing protein [Lactobacillus bombicola]RHW48869.1 hypothetical protein DS833_06720 [Lactobacillus bombicola]RHW53591.1 hypothetical protein DS834_01250 [Lactobacillus bombicola]
MNDLKVIGKEHIGKIEFTGIEGGFGKNKKAMLVKDIAQIHNQPLSEINRRINDNRSRFKNNIDIIDFLNGSEPFRKFAEDNDLIGSNRTQHVYLLSERGYAKLLKILDDDKAWDIYDQLVDNYFNMRVAIKNNEPSLVQQRRLSIMEENAATRKANMLYKLAMATTSESSKQALIAKGAEVLTGEMEIPILKEKYYSAGEIAKELNISGKKVGMIANELGLKAEQPGQNEYGRWANSKSKYSDKEVPQWLYTEKGLRAIKKELKTIA